MEIATFERIIRQSSLNLTHTLPILLRFLVSYHAESGRIQTDMLAYGRDEFNMMTEEDALCHIHECEERLQRASKTQQGIVVYKEIEPRIIQEQKRISTKTAINYPAH
jgi:hypothetical protein